MTISEAQKFLARSKNMISDPKADEKTKREGAVLHQAALTEIVETICREGNPRIRGLMRLFVNETQGVEPLAYTNPKDLS
jgi:hypothetical protein